SDPCGENSASGCSSARTERTPCSTVAVAPLRAVVSSATRPGDTSSAAKVSRAGARMSLGKPSAIREQGLGVGGQLFSSEHFPAPTIAYSYFRPLTASPRPLGGPGVGEARDTGSIPRAAHPAEQPGNRSPLRPGLSFLPGPAL